MGGGLQLYACRRKYMRDYLRPLIRSAITTAALCLPVCQRRVWLAALCVWDVCVQRKWRNTAHLWCTGKPPGAASGGPHHRGVSKIQLNSPMTQQNKHKVVLLHQSSGGIVPLLTPCSGSFCKMFPRVWDFLAILPQMHNISAVAIGSLFRALSCFLGLFVLFSV